LKRVCSPKLLSAGSRMLSSALLQTPRNSEKSRLLPFTSPPHLAANPLCAAIWSGCLEQVKCLIDSDSALVHLPCNTVRGPEPAVITAVLAGSPVEMLKLLLRSGASAHETNSAGLTALEVVVSVRPDPNLARVQPEHDSSWPDRTLGLHGDLDLTSNLFGGFADLRRPWPTLEAWGPGGNLNVAPNVVGGLVAESWALPGDLSSPLLVGGLPLSEAQRCRYAACLLASGCSGQEAAAAAAERLGLHKLALLICHWSDLQAQKMVRSLWARAISTGKPVGLTACPVEMCENICGFLAPARLLPSQSCHQLQPQSI